MLASSDSLFRPFSIGPRHATVKLRSGLARPPPRAGERLSGYWPPNRRRHNEGEAKNQHSRWLQSLSMLSFAATALAVPNVAGADVVNLDEFAVVKNGTTIFDDSFNQTLRARRGIRNQLAVGDQLRQRRACELLRSRHDQRDDCEQRSGGAGYRERGPHLSCPLRSSPPPWTSGQCSKPVQT